MWTCENARKLKCHARENTQNEVVIGTVAWHHNQVYIGEQLLEDIYAGEQMHNK